MMSFELSQDSLAMLLLCSSLGLPRKTAAVVNPLTLREWNNLAGKLAGSPLGRPAAFLSTLADDWKETLELTAPEMDRMSRLLARGGNLAIELERLDNLGIRVVTRIEQSYPHRLKQVLNSKSPIFIYLAGDASPLDCEGVAVVGSRDVDEAGASFTVRLAEKCVESGFTIVSGGARGVDQIAQNTAFGAGGKVVSVLAQGMEAMIRKRDVREAVLSGQLLLLSTAHPKAPFSVGQAMERNKYVYALSSYAVVVSSAHAKGGTWEGAVENLKHGWAPLFVRSGEDIPEGNRRLIERKEQAGIPLGEEALGTSRNLARWFHDEASVVSAAKACEGEASYQPELPLAD